MIYLFSKDRGQALQAVANRPIPDAFSFDGTLAPTSSDCHSVETPPTIHGLITHTACANISGTSLRDLTGPGGDDGHMVRNHGFESPFTDSKTLFNAQDVCGT